jgi:hypothetical protein
LKIDFGDCNLQAEIYNLQSLVSMRCRTLVLLGLLLISACSSTSPSAPSPAPIDVTGTWSGNLNVEGTQAVMTWTLTQQADNSVSGPVLVLLPNGIVLMNGFLTGKLTGSSLPYTITVGPGGIPALPACVGQLGGTMTATMATPSTLAGNFAVTSSTCASPFSNGNLTLTKR